MIQLPQNPLVKATDIYLSRGGRQFQNLVMPDLNTVEFSVTDTLGQPQPNAVVKLYERNGKSSFTPQKTDRYGRANFYFVPAGDYRFRIYKSSFKRDIEEDFKILSGSDTIRITRSLERE